MSSAKLHVEALLKLPPEERSAAAEVLLESLEHDDDADPASGKAWATEIERRVKENAPGIPADEVFADIRARFRTKE
jgi:putative addiction module component (TIGR02574 family)